MQPETKEFRTMTMTPSSRRRFLSGLGKVGALLATGSWLESIGYLQSARGSARDELSRNAKADLSRRSAKADQIG